MSIKNLAAIAALAMAPFAANATILNFSFEGFVESTNDGDNADVTSIGALNVDDVVTGSFLLDTSTMIGGVGTSASYADVVSNFVLNIDGYTYTSAATGTARVRDNNMAGSSAPLRDMFIASVGSTTGPTQGGLAPSLMQFSLGGTAALAVLSDVNAPSIAQFLDLFIPASSLLLLAGLGGLVAVKRRKG